MGIFQAPNGAGFITCDVCKTVDGPVRPGRPVNADAKYKWRTRSLKTMGKRWLCSDACEDTYMEKPF